jgi:hypothetical protein
MKRWLFPIWIPLCLMMFAGSALATEGFRVFHFGDSYQTVIGKGESLCEFGPLQQDSRWFWKTTVTCNGFDFKDGVRVNLYLDFSDDRLVRVVVVSGDIADYQLVRRAQERYRYLLPINPGFKHKPLINLADRLVLEDQVHQLGPGQRYITFHHQGSWEWEFIYEDIEALTRDQVRERRILENEAGQGLAGWNRFVFGDSSETIQIKLEGLCTDMRFSAGLTRTKSLFCRQFPFVEIRLEAVFHFLEDELVNIELQFPSEWYPILLNELKQKYRQPYLELTENKYYYPYIEFPAKNVILHHFSDPGEDNRIGVALKYHQEGSVEVGETVESVPPGPIFKKPLTQQGKIRDNL